VQRDGPEEHNGDDDGSRRTADNIHAASVDGIPLLIAAGMSSEGAAGTSVG
jgi:hypothetical protein